MKSASSTIRGRRAAWRPYSTPLVLAGYGLLVLSLLWRGVLDWYINAMYIWPTSVAGVILVLVAITLAVRTYQKGSTACSHEGGCDCETAPPSLRALPLLVLPLALAILLPPRTLAGFSARQRGPEVAGLTVVRPIASVRGGGLALDTRQFSFQDWVSALGADPNPRDYRGKPVHLSGVVLRDSSVAPPGFVMVIRYFVTCCIADARPAGLLVRDTNPALLVDNRWVVVTGKVAATLIAGSHTAYVNPTSVSGTKPGNPYVYQ